MDAISDEPEVAPVEIEESVLRSMLMAQVTAKRGVKAKVEERTKTGKCLLCERAPKQRGLCVAHVQQFYGRLKQQPSKKAQMEFEVECIREGFILPRGRQRQLTATDPFSKLAEEKVAS
jgi:hypothetical protein